MVSGVTLQVEPRRGRVDGPFSVTVNGLPPGCEVTLVVSTVDGGQREWTSRSRFVAHPSGSGDEQKSGTVDPSHQAPLAGSGYSGVDSLGPLWSVTGDGTTLFRKSRPTPLRYRIAAEVGGAEVAFVDDVERHFGSAVVHEPISEPGIVGTLHRPDDESEHLGVIIFGGSDGGTLDHAASLLADESYMVLALAYFGVEDRPASLAGIDLDEIDLAVSWLLDRGNVRGPEVAVIGISRGAELALQLAAGNPDIGPVVAVSPSALRQPGLTSNYSDFTQAAWVRHDQELLFNPSKLGVRDWFGWLWGAVRRQPMRQVESFREDLKHPDRVHRAAIEVERCRGPIMLVSGMVDQLWPSSEFADLIVARLRKHGRGTDVEDVRYAGVGHFAAFPFALPGLPPAIQMRPASFFAIDFGGVSAAHAAAARDAWSRELDFLGRWRARLDRAVAGSTGETEGSA